MTYCRRTAGVSLSLELFRELKRLVPWADIVHLTGVYSFPTIPTLLGCKLRRKPVVWSPRGGLQRWEGTRRRLAKWFWERACSQLLSPDSCVLHVTTEIERAESAARIQRARYAVIPNGVEVPEAQPPRHWCPSGILRLLFIGRLDPKKGIENLLQAVGKCRAPVALTICGAGDAPYVDSLRALTERLGIAEKTTFTGHVEGERREAAFFSSDVCVVPSFTENFAMVVAEALARGLPVVASRGTPWSGLEQNECGLWVDNSPESLAAALGHIREMDLDAMGARGREWMRRTFSWELIARRMHRVYKELLTDPSSARFTS